MSTEAQIAANRANAQKSTGPRTAEGKEKVAQNAVKHGLFSQKKIVFSENQVEFDMLEGEMMEELAPVGVMETMLAERIVSLMWRLKRIERMQNEVLDYQIMHIIDIYKSDFSKSVITGEPQEEPGKYDDVVLGFVANRDFGGDRTLERLALYERRFELSLYKTMAEFKKLQKDRAGAKSKSYHTQAQLGAAAHFEDVSSSKRGQDARDTMGDLEKQFIPKGSQFERQNTEYRRQNTEEKVKKQTQSEGNEDEHELLTSHVLSQNKANRLVSSGA